MIAPDSEGGREPEDITNLNESSGFALLRNKRVNLGFFC